MVLVVVLVACKALFAFMHSRRTCRKALHEVEAAQAGEIENEIL